MPIDLVIQARFEQNLSWERSWPKCFLTLVATIEILSGLVKMISIFLVCCTTIIRISTCSFVWNLITLIVFDIIFILTPTCPRQSQIIALNFIVQTITQFMIRKNFVLKFKLIVLV